MAAEDVKRIFFDLDVIDSIITGMAFDNSLVNFRLAIDHYFSEAAAPSVTIVFRNCSEIGYTIAEKVYQLNDDRLNHSHFTITKVAINQVGDRTAILLYTFDTKREFLKIVCQDVVLEAT